MVETRLWGRGLEDGGNATPSPLRRDESRQFLKRRDGIRLRSEQKHQAQQDQERPPRPQIHFKVSSTVIHDVSFRRDPREALQNQPRCCLSERQEYGLDGKFAVDQEESLTLNFRSLNGGS